MCWIKIFLCLIFSIILRQKSERKKLQMLGFEHFNPWLIFEMLSSDDRWSVELTVLMHTVLVWWCTAIWCDGHSDAKLMHTVLVCWCTVDDLVWRPPATMVLRFFQQSKVDENPNVAENDHPIFYFILKPPCIACWFAAAVQRSFSSDVTSKRKPFEGKKRLDLCPSERWHATALKIDARNLFHHCCLKVPAGGIWNCQPLS